MATITVETGSGSSSANSYVSEATLNTYASDRDISLNGTASVLLIKGMDYIEGQRFKGLKYTDTQALQWPRTGVYIDGYYVTETTIPQLLKDALCEVCIAIDGGNDPLANQERETKREKVGDLEVEYMDGGLTKTYLAAAENKLEKLLAAGVSGISAAAYRG
jgi:hypothetical protein